MKKKCNDFHIISIYFTITVNLPQQICKHNVIQCVTHYTDHHKLLSLFKGIGTGIKVIS